MMRRKTPSSILRKGLFAALLSGTALSPAIGIAQVPVNDGQNISEAVTQNQTSQQQLAEITRIRNLEQQQLETMGSFGPLGDLFGGASFSNSGSQSDFYTNMEEFAFDPCAINLCQGGSDVIGTTDINEAEEWTSRNFFASDIIGYEEERDLREVRRRGQVYASVKGLALSTITSNDLAGAGEEADALEQIVESSNTLRGDIRANSAIALAAYKVELQQLAVLTSLLEVEAMETISGSQIYHETGGTSFPDAFKEGDFDANDSTQRVRVTPPQQGSAGGSGFGGGLIGAIGGDGLSGLSSILGDSGLGSVIGNGGGLGGLMGSVGSGELPNIAPENLSLGTIIGDSASLAHSALPEGVSQQTRAGLSMVETGMAKGGVEGRTSALMGISQARAEAGGNTSLSSALNTGALALSEGSTGMAVNFAKGALRDLSKNGVVGQNASFLESQISQVESGSLDASTLVLNASTLLAAQGSDANAQISQILAVDPAQVTDEYLQSIFSDTIEELGQSTGVNDLSALANSLRNVGQDDIEGLRRTMEQASRK